MKGVLLITDGHCIGCGEVFPPDSPRNKLRCKECKRIHRNEVRKQRRRVALLGSIKICCECGADISGTRGRKIRCDKCQHKRNMDGKREKRQKLWEATEHLCKKCGRDISERSHNATICWACRRKNRDKGQKRYNDLHKEEHILAQKKYYKKNKDIQNARCRNWQRKNNKLKRKILEMDLPKDEPNSSIWVEWDDIPRCEGLNLSTEFRNTFGDRCRLRASYRLKDKYDGTERYLCPFHLKTIGSLKWYNIEFLEHQTIVRRETRLRWKKIQKKEIDKKKKIRNARKKKKKRDWVPGTPYNAHYPIINGKYRDQVLYPPNNSIDESE